MDTPILPSEPEKAAILFANEAFYLAFDSRDMAAMEAIWAQIEPVTCLHPGWDPMIGRANVLASWRAILNSPSPPRITALKPTVHLTTPARDLALVICIEQLEGASLIASNLFRLEGRTWHIMHHQASPTAHRPSDSAETSRQLQ
ncbi:MAG: nuclear transport factor 2 family protein [Magnetovibrionaceae bacterium]